MNTTLYILLIMTIGGVLFFSFSNNSTNKAMISAPDALQSNQKVNWVTITKNNDTNLLLTTKIIPSQNVKGYYAEYTLVNGRKICGQLGMPGPGGTFQTQVTFTDSIENISIYSDAEYYTQMDL